MMLLNFQKAEDLLFLTGVSKFAKVAILSSLNDLKILL
jgi:hypothetical protein